MSRSIWKGPYCSQPLAKALGSLPKHQTLKVWSRASTILPDFVGKRVAIHGGKDFKIVLLTPQHVGHKFGEFSPTKVPAIFKRRNK